MIIALNTRAPVTVSCHHSRESAVGALLAATPADYYARLDFGLYVFDSPGAFLEFIGGVGTESLLIMTQKLGAAVAEFKNLPRLGHSIALEAGLRAVQHMADDPAPRLRLVKGGRDD